MPGSLCRQRAVHSIPATATEFLSWHLQACLGTPRREAQQDAVPDPAGFVFHGAATHLLDNAIGARTGMQRAHSALVAPA
jgi:hypothetical protein